MKFRAKIIDIGCIHQFTKILSSLSKITKTSVVRLSEMNIVFTQTERVIGGGTSMWCELNQGDFFDEYRIEGKDETNQIFFEVINENLIRAMKSAQNAQSVKIRLTKKQSPCLTFEVILPSLTAHTRSVVHDVPVKIIPQRYWNEIQKPACPNYDIKVVLPPLRTIKNIVERMKNLSGFMVISASIDGNLQFKVETDDVTVATHFKNIPLENTSTTHSTSNVSSNEETFEARVDINKLVTFLNVQNFSSGNMTCGLISNQVVHLFVHDNDVLFLYFIPALNTYEVNYYHRQWWRDVRISYNDSFGEITLSTDPSEFLWMPDVSFVNAKQIQVVHHATRAILQPNGDVYVVKRLQARATCMLDFNNYPFDTQICMMQLESFAYKMDQLDNNWYPHNPVLLNQDVGKPLAGYDLISYKSYRKVHTYFIGDKVINYPNLFIEFKIRRALMYYIFQSYIPTILLMVLNFGSYWIPDSAIPARVTLIVTSFLASTLILQTATEMTVKLSHLTPMQIFMIVNISFIVVSLMQYLTVLSFKSWEKMEPGRMRKALSCQKDSIPNGDCKQMYNSTIENEAKDSVFRPQKNGAGFLHKRSFNEHYREKYFAIRMQRYMEATHPLDRVCRLVIPSLYVIFLITYWIYFKHHRGGD